MNEKKSYFAGDYDFSFFGNGTLSKLLIDFDCLFKGEWCGKQTVLENGILDAFRELRNLDYELYLIDVPETKEILEWLDNTFEYAFTCNDYPTGYADSCDHWTSISRILKTYLCSEGDSNTNRDIHFEGNWKNIVNIIKENDVVAQTKSARITYDDIDWNQTKKESGLVYSSGEKVFGGSYVPVEKFNEKSTELLKKIAKPKTDNAVQYSYKPIKERWFINSVYWDVNEDIASKYGVQIEIEQGSLYYRGTWLKIKVKAPYKEWNELMKICKQFVSDFGFDSRKELSILDGYDLPWTDEQKKREDDDDNTDFFFDSMDDDE